MNQQSVAELPNDISHADRRILLEDEDEAMNEDNIGGVWGDLVSHTTLSVEMPLNTNPSSSSQGHIDFEGAAGHCTIPKQKLNHV